MLQHKYQRSDKGIARKSRKASVRNIQDGQFLPAYPESVKQAAIDDAMATLELGHTTNQIGARHDVPGRTLRAWLLAEPRADKARAIMISCHLMEALDEIESADSPMPLARGRERFRAWSWIGERRLPAYYGQQIHQIVEQVGDLGDRLRRAASRITPIPLQVTDKTEDTTS